MKIFHIVDQIYFEQENGEMLNDLGAKKNKLLSERLKLLAQMKQLRDGDFWNACEALRKGTTLGYTGEELAALRSAMWQAESRMRSPLAEHDQKIKQISDELEVLMRPIRAEVQSLLGRVLEQIQSMKKVSRLGDEKIWLETKDGSWPKESRVRKVGHNLTACEEARSSVQNFKSIVATATFSEITNGLKRLEDDLNKLDFGKPVTQEIDQLQFESYRESRLL